MELRQETRRTSIRQIPNKLSSKMKKNLEEVYGDPGAGTTQDPPKSEIYKSAKTESMRQGGQNSHFRWEV